MNQNKRHLGVDVAEPVIAVAVERVGFPVQVAEPERAPFKSATIKIEVKCNKCGRKFEIDWFPFAAHPIRILTEGADLKPYLRDILNEEIGPFPDLVPCDPPSSLESCSACPRRGAPPQEGDTFKKRQYRGKFKTIGRENVKGSPVPEDDPHGTYDRVDQKLTVAHLNSRCGKGIDDANKQSAIREWIFEPEQLQHAKKVLDGLSLREIERNWGIRRMTASRGKEEIQLLANAENAPGHE
jgi:hypothetical protein